MADRPLHAASPAARSAQRSLQALRRCEELESLRAAIAEAGCFPAGRTAAPIIREEELKKLARACKLHHQSKSFWKLHPDKESLVSALRQHLGGAETPVEAAAAGVDRGEAEVAPISGYRRRSAFARRHSRNRKGPAAGRSVFAQYSGDHFGTNTPKGDAGMIYRSRLQVPGSSGNSKGRDMLKLLMEQSDGGVGKVAGGRPGGDDEAGGPSPEEEKRMLALQCATGLSNFALYEGGEMMVVREGAVSAALQLVAGREPADEELYSHLSCTLCNLSCNRACAPILLADGVLEAFGPLCRATRDRTKLHCALALGRLCLEPGFAARVLQESRYLNVLVGLLNHGRHDIKEVAAITMVNLTGGHRSKNKTKGRVEGQEQALLQHMGDMMGALVALATCKSPGTHRPALVAKILRKLSCFSASLPRLVDGGATPLLVLLSSLAAASSTSSTALAMRANCLVALCNISYCWAKRDKLLREGAAGALVVWARHAQGGMAPANVPCAAGMSVAELREICALALCNLATNRGTAGVVAAQGGTRALIQFVTGPYPVRAVHHGDELSLRIANALAVASARPCGIRRQLLEEGVVEACVHLASAGDSANTSQPSVPLQRRSTASQQMETLRLDLMTVLCSCTAAGERSCARVVLAGGLPMMLKIAANVREQQTLHHIASALCNLSNLSTAHGVLGQLLAPACAILVLLAATPNAELRHTCARCLDNLSRHPQARAQVVADGAVPMLLKIAANVREQQTLHHIASALCNLLHAEEATRETLVRQNCLPTLLALAREPYASTATHLCVASALCNLTLFPDLCALGQPDGCYVELLAAFLKLAEVDEPEVLHHCSAGLLNLSTHAQCLAAMGCNVAVAPRLIRMMRSGHGSAQLYAARCLQRCSGVAGFAAGLLMPGEADSTKTTCRDFVVIALLRVNNDTIKEICARAFFNLLKPVATRAAMMDPAQDVLWALVKLAQIDSLPTKRLCANALFNLTCDADSQAVLMKVGIGRVIKDLSNFRQADDMKILLRWADLQTKKAGSAHLTAEENLEVGVNAKFTHYRKLATAQRVDYEDEGLLAPKDEVAEKENLQAELIAAKCFPTTNLDVSPSDLRSALVHIEEVRKFCAAALCCLSWRKDGYVAQMVYEGAVEAALDLAQTGDKCARWNCATVLCNIAFHRPTQVQMVTDHAVVALSTLSLCDDSEIQYLCAVALFQLSTNSSCHVQMAGDSGAGALTRFLRDALAGHGPSELPLLSITALYNLSCSQSADSDQCISALVAAGTLSEAAALSTGAQKGVGQGNGVEAEAIVVLCARLIANMSCAAAYRDAMISGGAVAALVRLVANMQASTAGGSRSTEQQLRASCCVALCNLSFGTSLLAVALQEGLLDAVHLLLQSSSSEAQHQDANAADALAIATRCSIILRNLSCDFVAAPLAVERTDLMPTFSLLQQLVSRGDGAATQDAVSPTTALHAPPPSRLDAMLRPCAASCCPLARLLLGPQNAGPQLGCCHRQLR